jgi:hypothetical protein
MNAAMIIAMNPIIRTTGAMSSNFSENPINVIATVIETSMFRNIEANPL